MDHLVYLNQIEVDTRTSDLQRAASDERLARRAGQIRHAERVNGAAIPRPNALRVRLGQALVAAGRALAEDAADEAASEAA